MIENRRNEEIENNNLNPVALESFPISFFVFLFFSFVINQIE
jgi:hypothetical protein